MTDTVKPNYLCLLLLALGEDLQLNHKSVNENLLKTLDGILDDMCEKYNLDIGEQRLYFENLFKL